MNDDRDDLYQITRTDKVREYAALRITQHALINADFEDWEIEHAWWLEGQE